MRDTRRKTLGGVLLAASVPGPAWAHAFGTRYDLPLPLGFYLTGAGAAVALSFVVMARFFRHRGDYGERLRFDLLRLPVLHWLGAAPVLNFVRSLSAAMFVLLLAAGFFGNQDPLGNIAPTFVWIIWWVGMAFVSALAGNLWELVNPWTILFTWYEGAIGRIKPAFDYPDWLGRAPAVLLFLTFAWTELIAGGAEHPRTLATLIVAYSVVTWNGMVLFGRDAWLRNGEAFTIVYGLLARFAPTAGGAGRWDARPPAVGLLSERPARASTVCFVLLLLSTVTFDGLLETPFWSGLLDRVIGNRDLRQPLMALQNAGVDPIALVKTAVLVVLPCVFAAVFWVFCHAVAMFGAGGRIPTRDVVGYFVLSLVPIAIAYHLSHYLSYLLIFGQNIIPLASDPFGFGWDLFGTAGYRIDIAIVNAKLVWYLALTAIVTGHVLAVYLAHDIAMRVFWDREAALRSQIPMLVLMVAYTMLSLWILSQPIVE